MRRRDFLKTGAAATGFVAAPFLSRAAARSGDGPPALGGDHVTYVRADETAASALSEGYAGRHVVVPRLRALCRSPRAVGEVVHWARDTGRRFAVRSGGHCFEDFSQSPDLVIDLRDLNRVHVDPDGRVVAGAGAQVADILQALAGSGRVLPTGTCQSVALAGLVLGGGIGFLSRAHGLACDALTDVEIVDAEGHTLTADHASHADLFWACRGGGGGGFGIATSFSFRAVPIDGTIYFDLAWVLAPPDAARILTHWQAWTFAGDHRFGTMMVCLPHFTGGVFLRLQGLSTAGLDRTERHVARLVDGARLWSPARVEQMPFVDASDLLWTDDARGQMTSHRTRSLVTAGPLTLEAATDMLARLVQSGADPVSILIEPLGSAVSETAADATAFPHRGETQSTVQIAGPPGSTVAAGIYDALLPQTAGAYANYPDRDIAGWPSAYWGTNLPRLQAIKRRYDPDDVFRHRQSVPLA